MTSYFAVLYFGRRDISCILFSNSHAVSYFAEKSISYDGYNEKGFINPEDVFLKVERVIRNAESEYGVNVKVVRCALPSTFFRYGITEKDLLIPGGTVTAKDVHTLLDSCAVGLPGYTVVEKLPLFFKSFNNPVMADPVGQVAERLYVTASCGYLNNHVKELLDNCEKRLNKEFVNNSFAMLAAKRLDYDYLSGARRVVILFSEGTTDIALCDGAVPVEVRSIPWGETSIREGVKELLGCDQITCDLLMKRINLNLAFEDKDVYRVYGKEYSVKEINTFAAEAVEYFAKEVKSVLSGIPAEEAAVYLTGSDFCANRGVKELFEDELGKDVFVAGSVEPNIEGCKNYVLSAYAIKENKTLRSVGLFQKIFFRRK